MTGDPSKQWIEIFDWTKSNGRASAKTVQDIVRNFNAQEFLPPAIIGHKSSYPKDTRIPVGALITALKADNNGEKVFAQYDFPGKVECDVPEPYRELVGMSEFFKEAVNKKLYTTRSIGVGVKKDGSSFLEHVGYLGAQLPEIKGMKAHEFALLPEAAHSLFLEYASQDGITEFTESDTIMKDFSKVKFPESVKPTTQEKLLKQAAAITAFEFAADDPNETLVATLRDLWDIADATVEEIVGIAKKLLSQKEQDEAAAAGVAEAVMNRGYFQSLAKTADLKEFSEQLGQGIVIAIGNAVKPLGDRLTAIEQKQKEFTETPAVPAVPVAPATPAVGAAPAPVGLGLTQEQIDQAVEKAVNDLTASKNWIPAFDSTLKPIMPTLANTKYESGSCLDQLVQALSAVEGLAEMTELSGMIEFAGIERRVQEIKAPDTSTAIRVPNHQPTMNDEPARKVEEYMAANPGVNIWQATDALGL